MNTINLLYIGDIVGKHGRDFLASILPHMVREHRIDVVFANVENAAHGVGATRSTVEELVRSGVHAFSSGNHIWDKKDFIRDMESPDIPVVRPANFPSTVPGKRALVVPIKGHKPILLTNVMGRVYTGDLVDCPFRTADAILMEYDADDFSAVVIDIHAEATSEKISFAHYLDGRVSLIVGTHTHVATADQRILAGGTGYVTDLGMTGPYENSVLGVDSETMVAYFLNGARLKKWEASEGRCVLNAVLVTIDTQTHKTTAIQRVDVVE